MSQYDESLTGAYALGALTEQERHDFLATANAQQLREAEELEQTAAQLANLSHPQVPSSELKKRLMAEIKQTPQERVQSQQSHNQASTNRGSFTNGAAEETAANIVMSQRQHIDSTGQVSETLLTTQQTVSSADTVISDDSAAASKSLKLTRGFFALAACSALIAGAWGYNQHIQLQEAREQISALQSAEPSSAPVSEQPLIDQIKHAPDMSFAQGSMGSSLISIVYSPSHNMASISANQLPALPEGKAYMIWLYNKEGKIVGSGTLNDSGPSAITEMTNQDLSQVTDFGITVEDVTAKQPSKKPMMLDVMSS